MFEKEAEELIEESKRLNTTPRETVRKAIEFGFQKGIKAKVNTTTISDCPVKDEWHKVSEKLPEMDELVYLWNNRNDFPIVACRHIFMGKEEWVWDCKWGSGYTVSQSVAENYLWKEIILPKELSE